MGDGTEPKTIEVTDTVLWNLIDATRALIAALGHDPWVPDQPGTDLAIGRARGAVAAMLRDLAQPPR